LAPYLHCQFSTPTSNTVMLKDLIKKKSDILHLLKILHRKMSKMLTWAPFSFVQLHLLVPANILHAPAELHLVHPT